MKPLPERKIKRDLGVIIRDKKGRLVKEHPSIWSFKKAHPAWNKSLTKDTNESVKMISEKQKGKHNSIKTEFKKGHKINSKRIPWNKGKHWMPQGIKDKISESVKKYFEIKSSKKRYDKRSILEHHLYGREHNRIIRLTRSLHMKLYHNAYFYILEKFGKKGIDNYIKWFKKKFGAIFNGKN